MAEKSRNLNRTYRFTPRQTNRYSGLLKENLSLETSANRFSWLLFVQCNLLCRPCECSHQPGQITHNARDSSRVWMCVSHAELCECRLCSHTKRIACVCFLVSPGRPEHVPIPAAQNSPPSSNKTKNCHRVECWESGNDFPLQPHHDLGWRLHCRSDTNTHQSQEHSHFQTCGGIFTHYKVIFMRDLHDSFYVSL